MSHALKLAIAAILVAFAVAHVIGLRELQAAHPIQESPATLMPAAD